MKTTKQLLIVSALGLAAVITLGGLRNPGRQFHGRQYCSDDEDVCQLENSVE